MVFSFDKKVNFIRTFCVVLDNLSLESRRRSPFCFGTTKGFEIWNDHYSELLRNLLQWKPNKLCWKRKYLPEMVPREKMYLRHANQTRFWRLLGISFRISNKQPTVHSIGTRPGDKISWKIQNKTHQNINYHSDFINWEANGKMWT